VSSDAVADLSFQRDRFVWNAPEEKRRERDDVAWQ